MTGKYYYMLGQQFEQMQAGCGVSGRSSRKFLALARESGSLCNAKAIVCRLMGELHAFTTTCFGHDATRTRPSTQGLTLQASGVFPTVPLGLKRNGPAMS